MAVSNDVKVQYGIWIDLQILQQAGLGEQIQILVASGEIRSPTCNM